MGEVAAEGVLDLRAHTHTRTWVLPGTTAVLYGQLLSCSAAEGRGNAILHVLKARTCRLTSIRSRAPLTSCVEVDVVFVHGDHVAIGGERWVVSAWGVHVHHLQGNLGE